MLDTIATDSGLLYSQRMGEALASVIERLKEQWTKDPSDIAKKRFVPIEQVLVVTTGDIRKLAQEIGKDAELSMGLWDSKFLEAKALAILLLPLSHVDEVLISRWLPTLGDWSTCDLFVKTLFAQRQDALVFGMQWASCTDLYTKRAGLALIANICMRASSFPEDASQQIRDIIKLTASDKRDHVRQACCWALREFGKSNINSHEEACVLALELSESCQATLKWVGRCAYRELEDLIKVPERRRLISRKSQTGLKYAD